jgi:hypothetical protein
MATQKKKKNWGKPNFYCSNGFALLLGLAAGLGRSGS